MKVYEYIKRVVKGQILILILLIIDYFFPSINNGFVVPHGFEFMAFMCLSGITLGSLLSLKPIKEDLIEKGED